MASLLPIIDIVDNYRVEAATEPLLKFLLLNPAGSEVTVGWIREPVLKHLSDAPDVFTVSPDGVRFEQSLDDFDKRSAAVAALCAQWRDKGLFSETIGPKKWRDELYTIYYDPLRRKSLGGQEAAFAMERTCCSLFGFITYVRSVNLEVPLALS